jgi:hypothetical protein
MKLLSGCLWVQDHRVCSFCDMFLCCLELLNEYVLLLEAEKTVEISWGQAATVTMVESLIHFYILALHCLSSVVLRHGNDTWAQKLGVDEEQSLMVAWVTA